MIIEYNYTIDYQYFININLATRRYILFWEMNLANELIFDY